MKRGFKSIKSKIILFFILLAVFQTSVMAIFAKLHLEPSIVNMYSEHLDRSADIALNKTVEEIQKIENYTVNIVGDSEIQKFLEMANRSGARASMPSVTEELRNKLLSYTDYDNIVQAIYLMDNQGHIYSNQGQMKMQWFLEKNLALEERREASAVWYTEKNNIVLYRIVNNNTTDLTRKMGALCIFIDRE